MPSGSWDIRLPRPCRSVSSRIVCVALFLVPATRVAAAVLLTA